MSCPSTNNETVAVDDEFFSPDGIHWDAHRIGWAVAGGCAALTTLITLFTMTMHATHYQYPPAQRQVMRVLMMPAVYGIVSFFSYRYYREYEYYILAETAYEAVTLSAFLMLLMELVRMGTIDQDITTALKEKDKMKFPFPFNFWRFRASKPYFWHALSFSVMQYVLLRPLISIIGIICEYYGVLCPEEYSVHFAEVYLDAVDFVSISIALYGLIVFYVLCKGELKGKRPLSKFLAIKLIVFFTFYQSFLFSILQSHGVIKGTALWTATNVTDGLSALCTTVEMVFFSIYMGWAYSWTEYTNPDKNPYQRKTGVKTYFQAIWDTVNLSDFALEICLATKFLFDFLQGKPGTHAQPTQLQKTFMPQMGNEKPQEMSSFNGNANGNGNGNPYGTKTSSQGQGQGQNDNFTPVPTPRRTLSGNIYPLLRSPDSYQRIRNDLEADADGGEPYSTQAQARGDYVISPRKQSANNAAGFGARGNEAMFPSPHPTGPTSIPISLEQQISPGGYSPHSSTSTPTQWRQGQATDGAEWPQAHPHSHQQQQHPFAAAAAAAQEQQQQNDPYAQQQQQQGSMRYRQQTNDEDGLQEQGIQGNPRLF